MTSTACVYIVDDDDAVRASLQLVLASDDLPVTPCRGGLDFLNRCGDDPAGCAIMDLHMPGMNGLEVQQELLRRGITLPIIFLTGHGDVQSTVQAMRAGAIDFLEKPYSSEILLTRIHEALECDEKWRAARARFEDFEARLAELTPREAEILEFVSRGTASKVIAVDLDISERTVELHRARMMKKLGFRTLGELMNDFAEYRQYMANKQSGTTAEEPDPQV